MCGIHGFVTGKKRHNTADDFLLEGFIAGSLRGTDASGIASITTEKENYAYQKMPLPGFLAVSDKYLRALALAGCATHMISIAHTRSATTGNQGLDSAHPFVIEDEEAMRCLVGVHNGTLSPWKNKPLGNKFEVDSEWALNHIYDHGDKAFEDFNGSYSFVWWDSMEKDVLHMARNKDRPMNFAFTEDEGLVFGSEPGMLRWLCERNSIKIVKNTIYSTSEGFHYTFPTKNVQDFGRVLLPTPKSTYTAPAASSASSNTGYYGTAGRSDYSTTVVGAVHNMLRAIAGKPATKEEATVITAVSKPNSTQSEIKNARDLQIMNKEVLFRPEFYDSVTEELVGKGNCEGMLTEARVRSAKKLDYSKGVAYKLRCIGVIDDGTGIVVICALPSKAPVMPEDKNDTTVH